MIIRKKYPALERPFMQTTFQGYGSGRQGNISNITNEDTIHGVYKGVEFAGDFSEDFA